MKMLRKIKILLFVTFVLLSAACLGEEAKNAGMTIDTKVSEVTGSYNASEITASDFFNIYKGKSDYVLIDVRSEREWNSGHIPGAVHIPHTELSARIEELGLSKDTKIVLYCEAGVRSKKGANALLGMGYSNIVDITDGMSGWRGIGGDLVIPGEPEPEVPAEETGVPVLISAEELAKNRGSYRIVFLGTDNQYVSGHIPGAVQVNPLADLVDPEGTVPHLALGKADFEALMSRLGVGPGDVVVAYDDQPDQKYAARLFWILKYYGHENASILDGGLSAWKDMGGELTAETPQIQTAAYRAREGNSDLIATVDYVDENLNNPKVILVEATTKEEFEKGGHIPGAVLMEPEETLNPEGTIKDGAELQSIYTSKGITRNKEVITYCHTGYRGATIWFELKYLLDYPNVRLYDGSLEEWNALGMPLETGTPTTTTTTATTTTTDWVVSTTTKPTSKQSYLDVEPTLTLEGFEGIKTVNLELGTSIKIDDAYIYLTGDQDGCVGWFWWYFNIYRDTPNGAVWEGTPPMFLNEEVHAPMDVSSDLHKVSDALDDYKIVVTRWSEQEGLTIEISK